MRSRRSMKRRSKLRDRQRNDKSSSSNDILSFDVDDRNTTTYLNEDFSDDDYLTDYTSSVGYTEGDCSVDWERELYETSIFNPDDHLPWNLSRITETCKMLTFPEIVLDGLLASNIYVSLPPGQGLLSLPTELLCQISRFLPPIARCNLALTCRAAARVASENNLLDLPLDQCKHLGYGRGFLSRIWLCVHQEQDDILNHRSEHPGSVVELKHSLEKVWARCMRWSIIVVQSGLYTNAIHLAVGHWLFEDYMAHPHCCSCNHPHLRKGCDTCQILRRDEDCVYEPRIGPDKEHMGNMEREWWGEEQRLLMLDVDDERYMEMVEPKSFEGNQLFAGLDTEEDEAYIEIPDPKSFKSNQLFANLDTEKDEEYIETAERKWLKGKHFGPNLDLASGKKMSNGRGRKGKTWS